MLDRAAPALAIAAFSLVPVLPLLLSKVWPETHDGLRFALLFDQFRACFLHGHAYPRWLPDLYGGYGYPEFVFYQPGLFYGLLAVSSFIGSVHHTFTALFFLLFFLGGSGVFLLAQSLARNRTVSLFCALMFLLTPYFYVNLYVRGDFSELAALLLCPWPLYTLMRIRQCLASGRPPALPIAAAGLLLATIEYTHPFVAVFAFAVYAIFAVAAWWPKHRRATRPLELLLALLPLALGASLSCFHWLVVIQFKHLVNYENATSGVFDAKLHTVYMSQFLSRRWHYGGSLPGIDPNDMSLQLGLPHFILSLAGLWFGRKSRLVVVAAIVYAGSILIMSTLAVWAWEHVSALRYLQFPWRLLGVVALMQAMLIAGLGMGLPAETGSRRRTWGLRGLLAVMLLATLLWHANMFTVNPSQHVLDELVLSYRNTGLQDFHVLEPAFEWIPKTVTQPIDLPRGRKAMAMVEMNPPDAGTLREMPESTPYDFSYWIECRQPARMIVNQLYFPGWEVLVDGMPVSDATLRKDVGADGRMQLDSSPGTHLVSASYAGPPGFGLRLAVCLAGVLSAILLYALTSRRIRPADTAASGSTISGP
jgi:hypothetical protein